MQQEQLRQSHISVLERYLGGLIAQEQRFTKLNEIISKGKMERSLHIEAGMTGDQVKAEMVRVIVEWTRGELEKLKLYELEAMVQAIDKENARFGRS